MKGGDVKWRFAVVVVVSVVDRCGVAVGLGPGAVAVFVSDGACDVP